jgi:hypothetical protein
VRLVAGFLGLGNASRLQIEMFQVEIFDDSFAASHFSTQDPYQWHQSSANLFQRSFKLQAEGSKLVRFREFRDGVRNPAFNPSIAQNPLIMIVELNGPGRVPGRYGIDVGHQGSPQGKIGDLSLENLLLPLNRAGNGGMPSSELACVSHELLRRLKCNLFHGDLLFRPLW